MALPQIQAINDLVEQHQRLTDPAERDRALSALESELNFTMSNIGTYRGDAQVQLRGRSTGGNTPK